MQNRNVVNRNQHDVICGDGIPLFLQAQAAFARWEPTWTVSHLVATLTASFPLRRGNGSLKGLCDLSEEARSGLFPQSSSPLFNHFVCDFDGLRRLFGLLRSCIFFIVILLRDSFLHGKHESLNIYNFTPFLQIRTNHRPAYLQFRWYFVVLISIILLFGAVRVIKIEQRLVVLLQKLVELRVFVL